MSTWYYEDKGEPRGPISEIHLQSMLANGIIPVGTLVWQESFGKHWKPANETSLIPPKPTAAVPPPIVPTVAAQAVTAPTTVQPLSDVMTRWIALSPLWIMAFNVGMALLGFDFERPPASSWPFLASVALFILAERDAREFGRRGSTRNAVALCRLCS